ncbi:hypothetical protein SNEBB_005481 [Seison nebaliae]|nr:hypothetical protein SNEBB_005481 [Seison nebaliae]
MSQLKYIETDEQFPLELVAAGNRLVVAYFSASWCGPCKILSPIMQNMATKYSEATFLKLDVDETAEVAQQFSVKALPTIIFIRDGKLLEEVAGVKPDLEERLKKWLNTESESKKKRDPLIAGKAGAAAAIAGQIDLMPYIDKTRSECLNEKDEKNWKCLFNKNESLVSDCDNQLLLTLSFTQAVKLHSFKINAPSTNGPKTIKIFLNQLKTLSFDDAENNKCVQEFTLTKESFEDELILVKFVKFQRVNSITIFIQDNLDDSDETQIDELTLFGTTVETTNMNDFKRVSGKAGEVHG